jgi:putative SOS response-associated peptidase YedK
MCGRYGVSVGRPQLVEHFPHADFPMTIVPRYNIAPSQEVLVVRPDAGAGKGQFLRWGISLPSTPDSRPRELINVRAETALKGGLFHQLLDRSRALVPASHFYEWRRRGTGKQPVLIEPRQGLMALAGLLGRWVDPITGTMVPAVAILTCPANQAVAPVHNRMPVILDQADWQAWLDPTVPAGDVARLLVPCPEDLLRLHPVSQLVNDPRNDGPELLEAPPAREEQVSLPFEWAE